MKIIAFERIADGELFTLNEDGITYSLKYMKDNFPDNLHMKFLPKYLRSKIFKPIYEQE